jgi:hypothetical protein
MKKKTARGAAIFISLLCGAAVLVSGPMISSAGSAEIFRPVFLAERFIGAFDESGGWHGSPHGSLDGEGAWYGTDGEVTVDGTSVKLSEIQNDEGLMNLLQPGGAESEFAPDSSFSVSCETPLVRPGQKIVYWGADGEKGEGAVTGTYLFYEHYEPDENVTGLGVHMDPDAGPRYPGENFPSERRRA